MNPDQLHSASKKDLADKAHRLGIAGTSRMSKDDLVRAISRALKKKEKEREKLKAAKPKPAAPVPSLNGKHHGVNGKPAAPVLAAKKGKADAKKPAEPPAAVNPSGKPPRHLQGGHAKDRIVVIVRDPY